MPNLGDIRHLRLGEQQAGLPHDRPTEARWSDWHTATLWTGGFPCQDLSVAGKRKGLAGARSGLAFTFLDLVERHRPPLILLENVSGLLSSNGGADLLALAGRLVELGYGWAFRVLDAQFFGVPQRRRRVFILALRCGDDDPDGRVAAERAAAVLAVGSRCGRDHQAEREARTSVAGRVAHGIDAVGSLPAGVHGFPGGVQEFMQGHYIPSMDRPPPDADGVRAPDGLAGQLDGGQRVAATLNSGGNNGGFRTEPGEHLVYVKAQRAHDSDDHERWERGAVSPTVDSNGHTPRTATAVIGESARQADATDPVDPLGLDSHRYRVCGNGVVAPVAEWLGARLRRYVEGD